MLTKIFLSGCVLLALSICCHCARNYNLSSYTNLKPLPASATGTVKGKEVVFKYLKEGEPCTYDANAGQKGSKYFKALGHCIEDAGLDCIDGKCACKDGSLQWDPTVQIVAAGPDLDDEDDPQHLINGACAAPKGKQCVEFLDRPESQYSVQCLDGFVCNFEQAPDSSDHKKKGTCQ